MNIIEFIRDIIYSYNSLPYQLDIWINDIKYSFFEGLNIIDCNQLKKDRYIIKFNENTNLDINNKKISMFNLIDAINEIIDNKTLSYNFNLKDTTKTLFFVNVNINSSLLKDLYNIITKLKLPNVCHYVIASIDNVNYQYYFNNYFSKSYDYNQVLIKLDIPKNLEVHNNYILIKLCHDNIVITKNKISFNDKDSYEIVCILFPYLGLSIHDVLIKYTPKDVTFLYPITINFQLFDLMLYEYGLYPYIYTNETNSLIKNQGKIVYTINIYNTLIEMTIYNKWKQYTETIQFQNLEWYMYSTVKILIKYLYILYINFHKRYEQKYKSTPLNIPIIINYNRLFGKYYTRYFNNKDKILPVIADKEYCERNDIPFVIWQDNYYIAPENSNYQIIIMNNKKFNHSGNSQDGIPKCVKIVRNYTNKKQIVYSNISYELNINCKGKLPKSLFIKYGFEILNLYRNYLCITDPSIEFQTCSKCNSYISIPDQLSIVKLIKNNINKLIEENDKVNFKDFFNSTTHNVNEINVLSFSVNNDLTIYPYGVTNYVYNFNSSYPFFIVILNTSKLYSSPNYRFEYISFKESKLFNYTDNCVRAILSMYLKNNIAIIDNNLFKSCIGQFVIDDSKTVLITDKLIPESNNYLWHSIYT